MKDFPRKLLWIDGTGGAVVGVIVLLAISWLEEWHQLPRDVLLVMGIANLTYGTYSLSLASRKTRPMSLIVLLVVANLTWAIVCIRWSIIYSDTATIFAMIHLIGEAIYVGGLACLEWRWRDVLQTA